MNQRIRLLAEQAGLEYDFNPMLWLKYENFAELIVRECADKAHEFIIEDGDEFPQTSVAYRIKQHFGVEK